MQSSTSSHQLCTMCGTKTEKRCKTCNCSFYCSRECQKADWPVHKLLCREFPKFLTPPSATDRRAILFPDDGQGPKFVWVPTVMCMDEEDEQEHENVNIKAYTGTDSPLGIWHINSNMFRGRVRERTVAVYYRDNFLIDGSKANSGLLAASKGPMGYDWCGPILAMKLSGNIMFSTGYLNIDTVDFRDAVDYFLTYSSGGMNARTPIPPTLRKPPADVLGVRINCDGDRDLGGRAKFEATTLPGSHAVFGAPVCQISALIGCPIQLLCCTETDHLSKGNFNRSNQAATWLQMSADMDCAEWGFPPLGWRLMLGSTIVVRANREKLWPEHLDALCYFCKYVLQPLFADSNGEGFHPETPMSRQSVRSRITPREFKNFYIGYSHSKRHSSFKWADACPNPF